MFEIKDHKYRYVLQALVHKSMEKTLPTYRYCTCNPEDKGKSYLQVVEANILSQQILNQNIQNVNVTYIYKPKIQVAKSASKKNHFQRERNILKKLNNPNAFSVSTI